jgi:hypothetical protein
MQKLGYSLAAISDKNDGKVLDFALRGLYDRMSSQAFNSGALAQGNATTKMKTAAIIHGIAGGVPVTKPVTDDLWVPTAGHVVNIGKTAVLCLYLDAAGTASSAFGPEAATVSTTGLGGVKFPPMPEKKMMVGFVIISGGVTAWTAGTSTFTTSTTDYYCTIVNTVGMFDPTAVI